MFSRTSWYGKSAFHELKREEFEERVLQRQEEVDIFYYSGIHRKNFFFFKVKCWRSEGISSTVGFRELSVAFALSTELYFYRRKHIGDYISAGVPEIKCVAPTSNKRSCAPNSPFTSMIIYPKNLIYLRSIIKLYS